MPAGGDSTAIGVTHTSYGSVTGLLQDNFGNPVVNATVTAANGQHTQSDSSGRYTLYLPRGPTTITPGTVPGLVSPTPLAVPAGPSLTGTPIDFTPISGDPYLQFATLSLTVLDSEVLTR